MAYKYGKTGAFAGNESAPHDGMIDKIRLFAGAGGRFILQLARIEGEVKPCLPGRSCDFARVQVSRQVGRVEVAGDPDFDPSETKHVIRTIDVRDTKVRKGEYLALRSLGPILRVPSICGISIPTSTLQFQPVLKVGKEFRELSTKGGGGFIGCQMLVQAVMKS